MTRSNRHSACWPLLTTSGILPPFHSEEIALNSFAPKILLVTPTRSRFCRAFPKRNDCFQDFARYRGRGVYHRLRPVTYILEFAARVTNQHTPHCGFRAVIGCPIPASVAGVGILPCPTAAMSRNLRVRAALAIIRSLQSYPQSSYPISGRKPCRQM